jgi:tRNA(Ile)-lysidine synthetase-like protein
LNPRLTILPEIAAFESALLDDWARRGWDPSGLSLLICVSGGADSIGLLHACHRLAPRLRCRLSVVHVDHRLRRESAEEAAFVAQVCSGLAVPCLNYVLDPSSRLAGESVEMWARRERYARFEAAADEAGADAILTAHHRDDLVETFFQRLGRGTGPRGLAAIPFRRGRIARPLLDRTRAQVRAYAGALGAAWREDASNADVTLDRNWYRHAYLPALRAREPDFDGRVSAMAAAMASICAGFDALEAMESALRRDAADAPYLDGDAIAGKVREDDRESLRYWLQTLAREAAAFSKAETEPETTPKRGLETAPTVTPAILQEFLRQWKRDANALRVQIAPRLAFAREKRGIYCVRAGSLKERAIRQPKKTCSPQAQRVILDNGSAFATWHWGERKYILAARRFPRPANLVFPSSAEDRAIFDADRISCTLQVRIRKDGDHFSPLGIQSRSRKLKTFFNEEKVPAALRDSLPIVVSCPVAGTAADGESDVPAWVPGYGISDFFKVNGSTTHILELVMKCENP